MKMNLLTGAYTEMVPYLQRLHTLAERPDTLRIEDFVEVLDEVLDFEVEKWVEDILVDVILDAFQKLPTALVSAISVRVPLHDGVPLRLCLYLMDQNDHMAERVIEQTDLLDEMDLIYRINVGQLNELMAISRRQNLSPDVIYALIESKRPQVYLELLENSSIHEREDVVRHLRERLEATASGAWATAVSDRINKVLQGAAEHEQIRA